MSICFEEFCVTVFMTQWLKKMDVGDGKWKQFSAVFKTWKLKLSGKFVNMMRLWGPWLVCCQIRPTHHQRHFLLLLSFFFFFFLSFFLSFFFRPTPRLFFSLSSSDPLQCFFSFFLLLLLSFSFFPSSSDPLQLFFIFFHSFSFFLSSSDPLHHFHTCINLYLEIKTHTSFSWFCFLI